MFHKPFRVKSNTAVKSSERRKTRSMLEEQLHISQETSSQIIPNKDEMTVAKLVTHSGDILNVFIVNKNPALFEDRNGTLYPTVPLLWRFPDLLPRVRTWETVYHKLCGGADLMLPGVVVKGCATVENLDRVRKSQPVAIHVIGNVAPVAVAYANMSANAMVAAGMRGKGFVVVHTANDELFKFGKDKPRVPLIPDLELTEEEVEESEDVDGEEDSEGEREKEDVVKDESSGIGEECAERESVSIVVGQEQSPLGNEIRQRPASREKDNPVEIEPAPDDRESLSGLIADLLLGSDDANVEENDDERHSVIADRKNDETLAAADDPLPSVSMDERLRFYFKVALRYYVRPSTDLPASPQELYKAMQAARPDENVLDFRKSSFKKPLKFFQEMQTLGLLKLKEETKGVWTITDVDKQSEVIRRLDLDFLPYLQRNEDEEEEEVADSFQPPVVREMLSVNANVLPLFRDAGVAKGAGVTMSDMRRIVTDYVKNNDLCPADAVDKSRVKMNPQIAGILLEKGENNVVELTWNQIFQRLPKKMGQCYSLEYPGQPPLFKKGGLPPVALNIETRSGNKKVTLVTNLETYGVNPQDLAKEIRVGAAASSSVSAAPGQKAGAKQVLIQGNQVNLVVAILTEKYNIDKKHINGIEKGEKKKKR